MKHLPPEETTCTRRSLQQERLLYHLQYPPLQLNLDSYMSWTVLSLSSQGLPHPDGICSWNTVPKGWPVLPLSPAAQGPFTLLCLNHADRSSSYSPPAQMDSNCLNNFTKNKEKFPGWKSSG